MTRHKTISYDYPVRPYPGERRLLGGDGTAPCLLSQSIDRHLRIL
jgi:hypothetical protein